MIILFKYSVDVILVLYPCDEWLNKKNYIYIYIYFDNIIKFNYK